MASQDTGWIVGRYGLILRTDDGGDSLHPQESTTSEADLTEGQHIYEDVCAECHAMDPPPTLAPPMRMVAGHLRDEFETEDEAVAHVVSYVTMPNPERSILPEHAIERFGLMAPLPLPAADLDKVARYVWSLSEGMGSMHEEEGEGMRMRMRRRGGGGG
jgi:mono/diheme cytochrome c family protein